MLVSTSFLIIAGHAGAAPPALPPLPVASSAPAAQEDASSGFDFSYTYVELGFGFLDVDDFEDAP